MQKLNDQKIIQLISLVRQNPEIYERKHEFYKNATRKEQLWFNIANCLEAEVSDCKTAWKSLRDQFNKSIQDHQNAKTPIKTKYKYFDELYFLKNVVQPRRSKIKKEFGSDSQNCDDSKNYSEEEYFQNIIQEEDESNAIYSDFIASVEDSSQNFVETDEKYFTLKRKRDESPNIEALEEIKNITASKKTVVCFQEEMELDDVDKYFLVLSTMVKNYNLSLPDYTSLQCNLMLFLRNELEKNGGKD